MSIDVTMDTLQDFDVTLNEVGNIPIDMDGVTPIGAPMYFGTTARPECL